MQIFNYKMSIQEEYELLKKKKFPLDEICAFSEKLKNSNDIDYHFHLLVYEKNISHILYKNLVISFLIYWKQGIRFLEDKLDSDNKTEAVYASSFLSSQLEHSKNNDINIDNLVKHLRNYIKLEDRELRKNSIISLGRVGTEEDIDIFCNILLNDSNDSCRAWAIIALGSLTSRVSKDTLQKKVCDTLIYSLSNETDLMIIASVISTVQNLWDKKLGISFINPKVLESDKIIKAKNKALKLLNNPRRW